MSAGDDHQYLEVIEQPWKSTETREVDIGLEVEYSMLVLVLSTSQIDYLRPEAVYHIQRCYRALVESLYLEACPIYLAVIMKNM